MKILFVVQNIVGQGTYLRAIELALELKNLGHSVTIMASSVNIRTKTNIKTIENVRIIEVSDFLPGPFRSGWDLKNIITRSSIIQSSDYDIVHGFESRPTVIFPSLFLRQKGVPLFLDWADWFGKNGSVEERPNPLTRFFLRPIETFFEEYFRKYAVGTTVICQTLQKRALDFGINPDQICLIPNGFNIRKWKPLAKDKARRKIGLNEDIKIIGYLGSLFQRDSSLMANAYNLLIEELPQTHLLHIGKSNYRTTKLINEEKSLIETGPVDFNSMMDYLSCCDVLWLPFRNTIANQGRFPLKFTNYLACGRPIISTDVGDVPKYIKKYNVGIITEDLPNSISNASIELLKNQAKRELLARNALNLSNNPEHSWASRARKLEKFYISKDYLDGK